MFNLGVGAALLSLVSFHRTVSRSHLGLGSPSLQGVPTTLPPLFLISGDVIVLAADMLGVALVTLGFPVGRERVCTARTS